MKTSFPFGRSSVRSDRDRSGDHSAVESEARRSWEARGPGDPGHSPAGRRVEPWAEAIEWVMDRSIRIGPWTIGLDPLLGLVPGAGDLLSGCLSILIVLHAIRLRIPRIAVARMVLNVVLDTLLGTVPFVGDAFDFVFKANTKNVAILREALAGHRRTGHDWFFVGGVILVLVGTILLPLLALWVLVTRFS